jgi:hypothetical protein
VTSGGWRDEQCWREGPILDAGCWIETKRRKKINFFNTCPDKTENFHFQKSLPTSLL